MVSKVPFWQFFVFAKMALLSPSMGLPGSAKSRIYAGKVQKGDFLRKDSQESKKKFLFQVPMNLPKAWDAKLGAGSFFAF